MVWKAFKKKKSHFGSVLQNLKCKRASMCYILREVKRKKKRKIFVVLTDNLSFTPRNHKLDWCLRRGGRLIEPECLPEQKPLCFFCFSSNWQAFQPRVLPLPFDPPRPTWLTFFRSIALDDINDSSVPPSGLSHGDGCAEWTPGLAQQTCPADPSQSRRKPADQRPPRGQPQSHQPQLEQGGMSRGD